MKTFIIASLLSIQAMAVQAKLPDVNCNIEKYLKQCESNTSTKKEFIDFEVAVDGMTKDNFIITKKGSWARIKMIDHKIRYEKKGNIFLVYPDGEKQRIRVTISDVDGIEKSKEAVNGLKGILKDLNDSVIENEKGNN